MRRLSLLASLLTLCLTGSSAYGQQVDVAFGVSGLSAPAGTTDSSGVFFPTMGGGAYPGVSGDFLLKNRLGFEGEVFWRASQNLYGGFQPFRPIFYDFNAIWAPRLTKSITAEVLAGIGGENLRFYTGNVACDPFNGNCTNYVSRNQLYGGTLAEASVTTFGTMHSFVLRHVSISSITTPSSVPVAQRDTAYRSAIPLDVNRRLHI